MQQRPQGVLGQVFGRGKKAARDRGRRGGGPAAMDSQIVDHEGMRPILNWVDKISEDEEHAEPGG